MDESPKRDRTQAVWWSLLVVVTLAGLAVPGKSLPLVVLAVVAVAFVKSVRRAAELLPDRVASHFNFSMRADGWMGRRWYLIFIATLTAVVGGLLPLGFFVVATRIGDAKMERLAIWLACLVVGLMTGLNELTVRANQREPAEMPQTMWALLGVFLLAINLWGLAYLLPW